MKQLLTAMILLFVTVFSVQADEYSPAYLELKQQTAEQFKMLWKVPSKGADKRLALYLHFPDDVTTVKPATAYFVGNAFIERSTISRKGGLVGAQIQIDGLAKLQTEVLVRIERLDGSTEVARLTPDSTSFVVNKAPTFIDVAKTYVKFGIEHIWAGIDHLLFVACLVLISGTGRRILITITGFTVAHSITLTLAALQLVSISIPPVEAVIALSIVFLAREIVSERRDTLTWRYPITVSASFGLLHGFGFASALGDIGLPATEIPAALLSFNIGVEIGQISFVLAMVTLLWFITRLLRMGRVSVKSYFELGETPIAYIVGGIAMLWTLERVAVFWI